MITASVVPSAERLAFLPKKFPDGALYLLFEANAYTKMRAMTGDYGGGFWDFYDLSNGGLYIAPRDTRSYRIEIPSNGYEGTVSADAAGIIASLFALNALTWQYPSDHMHDLYYWLRDYAATHPEGAAIYGAID